MVRVISVHHFASQDIHTCEDPTAVASAPPDRLLLALSHHVIEVRDLAQGGNTILTFPTVDQVQHMVYCCQGNYVATLEAKQNRQGKEAVYARIYANWDTQVEGSRALQPMRARIAGRVTPSSAQSGAVGLEMIELPLIHAPVAFACCQTTGNLVLSSQHHLIFYLFRVRTHDISRHKFIDFEEWSVRVELSFPPSRLALAENVVAAMGPQHVQVFQLTRTESSQPSRQSPQPTQPSRQSPQPVSAGQNSGKRWNGKPPTIDWDELLKAIESDDPQAMESWKDRLHPDSFPVVVNLPTIVEANSTTESLGGSGGVHRHSPFLVAPPDMTVTIKNVSPSGVSPLWVQGCQAEHLLQLRMIPPRGSSKQGQASAREDFRCLILDPVYLQQLCSKDPTMTDNPQQSPYHAGLVSVVCLVATQQEGYLYHFPLRGPMRGILQQEACITVYPFTAPVSQVALERTVLHALTDTGLETYTLRVGHHLLRPTDNLTTASPACSDPICLVGLRPFLGVEHLVVSSSYLALLACSETASQDSSEGNWTLYSLRLPGVSTLYHDILSVASTHRWSGPSTYGHLLAEAHVMVWTTLATVTWVSANGLATPHPPELDKAMEKLYRESCALLADYHITCDAEEEQKLATPYYKMCGLGPSQVVERVHAMNIPEEALGPDKNPQSKYVSGLMGYLKTCLLLLSNAPEEDLFSRAVPHLAHTLLDLFQAHAPDQVSVLVLRSALLREHAAEQSLDIIKQHNRCEPCDVLAMAVLHLQRSNSVEAVAVLATLTPDQLTQVVSANHDLLFETTANRRAQTPGSRGPETVTSFSELSSVLIESRPRILATVLARLVSSHPQAPSLELVLRVFLDFLPAKLGSGTGQVLQLFLEEHLAQLLATADPPYQLATIEAFKILVRSYLGDLQRPVGKGGCDQEKALFLDARLPYLNKMPPFAADLAKRLVSLELEEGDKEIKKLDNDSLIKLQALLCSGKLPDQCVCEVQQFLETHPHLHGNLSLQVLCVAPKQATSMMLDFCPQALLQYTKDTFSSETEWKPLLLMLQKKVEGFDESPLKMFYMKVTKDVLTHLAQTLPLENFVQVLPPDGGDAYESYIDTCEQTGHANHIRALIIATGQQLLTTLNL